MSWGNSLGIAAMVCT